MLPVLAGHAGSPTCRLRRSRPSSVSCAEREVPLSPCSAADLAVEAVAAGVVDDISASTVGRWLAANTIKPWRHRSCYARLDEARLAELALPCPREPPMSMASRVEQYLQMRRRLGFTLLGEGRMLRLFADWLDHTGQTTITIATAVAWVKRAEQHDCSSRSTVGRGARLARYLAAFAPACQIPPPGLLPARAHPDHYTAEEIAGLVHAADTIAAPLPAATMQALISLIAASGLRTGEVPRPQSRPPRRARRDPDGDWHEQPDPHGATASDHDGDALRCGALPRPHRAAVAEFGRG